MENTNNSKLSMLAQPADTKETVVYNKIKQAIMNNDFPPGTVMVERKLCEIYQVSRSPVRYALRQLAAEGLLDTEPGKGIIVPVYTLEDILEVYDLLEILQTYALEVSLKNYGITADAALESILKTTEACLNNEDMIERMEWDIKFHEFIIHYVSNKRLDMMFEMLINQKRRFDITSNHDIEHGRLSYEQHVDIFKAIQARDLEGSQAAIRAHCQYIKKYYINRLVTGKYNL